MSTCLDCNAPVPVSRTRPRRFCGDSCNARWRRRNPGAPLPAREGVAGRWDALRDAPALRSELGPARPPLGMTEEEAWRARRERLLRAIRDGVEIDALEELSGLSRNRIQQAACRAGLRIARTRFPFGTPHD